MLTASQEAALQDEGLYVQIHTVANPGGDWSPIGGDLGVSGHPTHLPGGRNQ